MDPLGCHDDPDQIIGIVDDNSVASQDMLQQSDELEYTFKTEDGADSVVTYRVVQMSPEDVPTTAMTTTTLPQYYVINPSDFVNATTISPKLSTFRTITAANSVGGNGVVGAGATITAASAATAVPTARRRDERRRQTHNAVERRRRDKINHLISQLGNIIPAERLENSESGRHNFQNSEVLSKGSILLKACDYIQMLQDTNASLTECLKDNDKIVIENRKLEQINCELRKENDTLKDTVIKHGLQNPINTTTTIIQAPSALTTKTSAPTKPTTDTTKVINLITIDETPSESSMSS